MKKLIKRSLCVLISAVIVFSTAAYGFMSTAADSHYTDNIRWIDTTTTGLEQMWDNDETFIFVLYSTANGMDLCRDIGTEVFEEYWMNTYDATIYGVDVFDFRFFGDHDYDTYIPALAAIDPEYDIKYNYFHLPDFLQEGGRYDCCLDVTYDEEGAPPSEPRNLMPLPIIGFVKDGAFMTLDVWEEASSTYPYPYFIEAVFPVLPALIDPDAEVGSDGTKPPRSVYENYFWSASDLRTSGYSMYKGFTGYQQHLLDINKAFFTFFGENPIYDVFIIPPGAEIDPGESLQTLKPDTWAIHNPLWLGHDYPTQLDFNFDGFGLENYAAGLGVDPYDDDYWNTHAAPYSDPNDYFEDDYYDFSENNINRNVKWTSSDPSKITVDQNGKITAVSPFPATVTITCETEDQRLAPWLPGFPQDGCYESYDISIIEHDWDIQILPGDGATCAEDGIRTYTCREEGCRFRHYVYTEVIPKATAAHTPAASYTPVPGHEANCLTETNGQEQLLCTKCGAVIDTRYISWQSAHIWVRTQVSTRTCTQDGVSVEECSRCHAIKPNSEIRVYATGHVPSSEYSYLPGHEPTCTEDGQEATFCTVCNQPLPSTTRTVPALGHDWGESYEDANGDQVHECIRCHIIESAELSFWERVVQFFRELFASIFGVV